MGDRTDQLCIGAAGLVVGQPFDVVKVRYQTPEFAGRYASTFGAFGRSYLDGRSPDTTEMNRCDRARGEGAWAVQGCVVADGESYTPDRTETAQG
jgi:hypothetical protein